MNFAELEQVNAEVNALPYVDDAARYGEPEFWERIDAGGGDCEDYALGKLNALLARGWPIAALRLACCYVETGEYHGVLLADLGGQTYVLDNRHPRVMEYNLMNYKFDRWQKAGGSREWVSNG